MHGTYDQIVAAAQELGLLDSLEALASVADVRTAFEGMRALVKTARVEKARKVHPDLGGSVEEMARVNAAADVMLTAIDEALAAVNRPRPPFVPRRSEVRVYTHYGSTTTGAGDTIWLVI